MQDYIMKQDVIDCLGCTKVKAQSIFSMLTAKCKTETKQEFRQFVRKNGTIYDGLTFVSRCELGEAESVIDRMLSDSKNKTIRKDVWEDLKKVCECIRSK